MTDAWQDVDDYLVGVLVEEDDALVRARSSGAGTTMPRGEVSVTQGKLIFLLASMIGARAVLEFGTLAGYSTIWLARAVGPGGRVTSLELEPQNAGVARTNLDRAGLGDRVEVLVGPASETADTLTGPYDFVFIDADKPSNPAYLRAALRLTRPGSVIVIDNVVRGGAVLDADSADQRVQGVRTVLADIAGDPTLDATAIQTVGSKGWDGFTLVRRTG